MPIIFVKLISSVGVASCKQDIHVRLVRHKVYFNINFNILISFGPARLTGGAGEYLPWDNQMAFILWMCLRMCTHNHRHMSSYECKPSKQSVIYGDNREVDGIITIHIGTTYVVAEDKYLIHL